MKIKSGFVLREVAGQAVVVALGSAAKNFNGMIKLNSTGKFIWNILTDGAEREDVINKVLEVYDVDRATVEADVDRIIKELKEANILE